MQTKPQNEYQIMKEDEGIVLFYPNIPKCAIDSVADTLKSRWIGQGPKVDKFEKEFAEKFTSGLPSFAVGSGTDALHLSYILAGLKMGDEVISPVFTCTATNTPFLYMGVKIRFADINPQTMNINVNHVKQLVNEKTKAIVCVHYGGLPADMKQLQKIADKWEIPIIEDAAHAIGATYKGKSIGSISDFTMFSFQAIKHITTGDGGMLVVKDKNLIEKAKRIRWFGIDRTNKQKGIWENDIFEIGYKYQMTDIGAAIGLASLKEFDKTLLHRKTLFHKYEELLSKIDGIKMIGTGLTDREHAAWLCTIITDDRIDLMKKLRENNIESAQVHYRNDRYTVFKESRGYFPNMDKIENKYLVLPLHTRITIENIEKICDIISKG